MSDSERVRVNLSAEAAALKADIDIGLADVTAGRVHRFDSRRIAERGRKLLAERSSGETGNRSGFKRS